jgi:hypothetical protein
MSDTFPVVMTDAGIQPQSPMAVRDALLALVQAAQPGYTANLPGSLIEDISSTDTFAILLADAAKVELVNSLTPYGANNFLLTQLGNVYGVPLGLGSTTSVEVNFTGTPGFVISAGFTVSDGTYQYVIQSGGIVGDDGQSGGLFALSTTQGRWAVPANTVNILVTSVPSGISLSVTNPQTGTPGTTEQTPEEYRRQVLIAGQAVSQGMPTILRTALQKVPGVQSRLISVRQQPGGWQILVGGGDPYQVAYAIFQSLFDVSTLVGSSLAITNVTQANPGVVTTNINHGLLAGSTVEISGVVGMTELNGNSYVVTPLTPTTFSLDADTTSFGVYSSGGTISPEVRNQIVAINDFPDAYIVTFVQPLLQVVTISVTWGTTSPNIVAPAAVAQLAAPALVGYINSIVVGQPINLFQLQAVFQQAVASVIPAEFLTRMIFVVSIDGVSTPPDSGTGIIDGDPEGYFFSETTNISITQG